MAVALALSFLSSFVFWGAICIFVAWLLAKLLNRSRQLYIKRGLLVAVALAAIAAVSGQIKYALESPRSAMQPLDSTTQSVAQWPPDAVIADARAAHSRLQEEVGAFYALILDWNNEVVAPQDYMRRADFALQTCREAVTALEQTSTDLHGYDNEFIRLMIESFSIKRSQVHCLEQIHQGIVKLESGEVEAGAALIEEYDERMGTLQDRYMAIGEQLVSLERKLR